MATAYGAHTNLDEAQTAQAKQRILELRAEGYSGAYCAGQVGIARRTLYNWTETDPDFARAWQDANESRLDWHEDVLRDCASKGMFVPSLAVLKSAGRIIDRQAPAQVNISLYQVFQQILAPDPKQPAIEVTPRQLEHLGEPAQQEAPQLQDASSEPQLEDGTTQPIPKGKPSAKPASRRRPERQPLPR